MITTVIMCVECRVWWVWEENIPSCNCEKGIWLIDAVKESEWGI